MAQFSRFIEAPFQNDEAPSDAIHRCRDAPELTAPAIEGLDALPLRRDERRVLEQAGQIGKRPSNGIQIGVSHRLPPSSKSGRRTADRTNARQ